MAAKVLHPSPLSVAVAAVVVALAVSGTVLTKQNADQQNTRLLRDQATQASISGASYLDALVDGVTAIVAPIARYDPSLLQSAVTAVAHADPAARSAVDVFEPSPEGFVATAAAGPGASVGETASPSLTPTLADALSAQPASNSITPPFVPTSVVRSGAHSTVGFSRRVALTGAASQEIVFFNFTIDPFAAGAKLVTSSGPFEQLRLALYSSARQDSAHLLGATTSEIPLIGSTYATRMSVGTNHWLLVVQAGDPLAGSFASAAPWVILALGILLAVLLAGTVEILVRRQRYAHGLVAARTKDLETSLEELRAAQEKVVLTERLSALGEMASVVGHELRNPLTAVTNSLFLVRGAVGDPTPEGAAKHLDMAERETQKATVLAEDLTAFVRPRHPVMAELDLADVVNEVIEASPPPEAVDLEVDAGRAPVVADRDQLAEVLTNLVTNAYQAVREGGSVRVRTRASSSRAEMVVEDSGAGFDPEMSERIFEPFFTTRTKGTGLGLAIVRRVVHAHGGEVSIVNVNSHGARVTVVLPVAPVYDRPISD